MAIKANRIGRNEFHYQRLFGTSAIPAIKQYGETTNEVGEVSSPKVEVESGPPTHDEAGNPLKGRELAASTRAWREKQRQKARMQQADRDAKADVGVSPTVSPKKGASQKAAAQDKGYVEPVKGRMDPDTRVVGPDILKESRRAGVSPDAVVREIEMGDRLRSGLVTLMRQGSSGGNRYRTPTAPVVPNRFGAAGAGETRVWNEQNINEAPPAVQASIRGMQQRTMDQLRTAVRSDGGVVKVDTTNWTPEMRQEAVALAGQYKEFAPQRQAAADSRAAAEAKAAEDANKASAYLRESRIMADRKARIDKHLTGQRKVIKSGEGQIDTTYWTPKMRQDLVDKWQAAGRKAERARKAEANAPAKAAAAERKQARQAAGVQRGMQKFADKFATEFSTPKAKKKK